MADNAVFGDAETEPAAQALSDAAAQPPADLELDTDTGSWPWPEREFEPHGQLGGIAVMPAFQFGGRVERTGIALVHEGEYVVPAPGSEAVVSPAGGLAGQSVVWSFPVEVEVVGELSEEHLRAVATHVFNELDTALRRIG